LAAGVEVGDRVRIPLHGRRVGGWIVRVGDVGVVEPEVPLERLLPISAWSGRGPDAGLVDLTEWAAHRWAGRRRSLLVTASPPSVVRGVPQPAWTVRRDSPMPDRPRLRRLPPAAPLVEAVTEVIGHGTVLVVVPEVRNARALAARLGRLGHSVAIWPDEWARAAGGIDVVVGARSAAWARCRDLAAVVLLDEHDEALQEERNPTWHARDVLVERCRRLGVPFLAVSPCPSVVAVHELGPVQVPSRDAERAGWPIVEVVDRTDDPPWQRSLVTPKLQVHLRDEARTVVCVLNTKGRARILACAACGELQRCERCDAAVMLNDDRQLVCPRCATVRPEVCTRCGASSMRLLRPGVSRLREELEAAARRPVVAVDASVDELPAAGVYVGTEAVLHRLRRADVVAFLDFDAELLAPRYRAAEQAMALLVRAARMVGPKAGGGRLLVQTFLPRHEVVRAALLADPGLVATAELARRKVLSFPPFGALAALDGTGADELADDLRAHQAPDVHVLGPSKGRYLVQAPDAAALADILATMPRPPRSRVRVEVDPPRL
jgi:primosomal protein N' (replication factor Y)